MIKPICCGQEAKWVENIPGKGYHFCAVCREEVATPLAVEEAGIYNFFDSANPTVGEQEDLLDLLERLSNSM